MNKKKSRGHSQPIPTVGFNSTQVHKILLPSICTSDSNYTYIYGVVWENKGDISYSCLSSWRPSAETMITRGGNKRNGCTASSYCLREFADVIY